MKLVECVPNFSEGRSKEKINEIISVIKSITGVEVKDIDMGSDTNRTVVTFVGNPEAVKEAAFLSVSRLPVDCQILALPRVHSPEVQEAGSHQHRRGQVMGADGGRGGLDLPWLQARWRLRFSGEPRRYSQRQVQLSQLECRAGVAAPDIPRCRSFVVWLLH